MLGPKPYEALVQTEVAVQDTSKAADEAKRVNDENLASHKEMLSGAIAKHFAELAKEVASFVSGEFAERAVSKAHVGAEDIVATYDHLVQTMSV